MPACAARQAEHWRSAYSTRTTELSGLLAGWGPRFESTMGHRGEAQAMRATSIRTTERLMEFWVLVYPVSAESGWVPDTRSARRPNPASDVERGWCQAHNRM